MCPKAIGVFMAVACAYAAPGCAQPSTNTDCAPNVVAAHAPEGPLHAAARRAGAQSIQTNASGAGWVVRHPVMTGTLAGTGAGVILSRIDSVGGKNHDLRVAVIGAGAGAWGGLIASAVHKARTKQKIGGGTKAGIIAGAVGLVVLPLVACYGAGGCGGSS